jgi:hypothetical protein
MDGVRSDKSTNVVTSLGLITASDHRGRVLQKTVKVFPLHPYRTFTVLGYIRRFLPKIKDVGSLDNRVLSGVHSYLIST